MKIKKGLVVSQQLIPGEINKTTTYKYNPDFKIYFSSRDFA